LYPGSPCPPGSSPEGGVGDGAGSSGDIVAKLARVFQEIKINAVAGMSTAEKGTGGVDED